MDIPTDARHLAADTHHHHTVAMAHRSEAVFHRSEAAIPQVVTHPVVHQAINTLALDINLLRVPMLTHNFCTQLRKF